MDKMLGSNHIEREDSELGNSARRPELPSYDALPIIPIPNLILVRMKSGGLPEMAKLQERLILVVR